MAKKTTTKTKSKSLADDKKEKKVFVSASSSEIEKYYNFLVMLKDNYLDSGYKADDPKIKMLTANINSFCASFEKRK